MQSFSIREKGYDVSEVDKALAKIRAEYEEKLRKQDEDFTKTKTIYTNQIEQKNHQIVSLEQKIEQLREIIKDYTKREERTQNILESTNNLKALETQRLHILYNKWENLLENLKSRVVPFISHDELMEISQDFHYALKLVVDSNKNMMRNDQSFAKSLLTRMSGKKSEQEQTIISKKYVSKITPTSVEEKFVQEEITINNEPSQAEQFLNGNGISIPKTLGIGKEVLNIPGKQKKEKKQKNFSLEEALTPKESLAEIMTVFNLDD